MSHIQKIHLQLLVTCWSVKHLVNIMIYSWRQTCCFSRNFGLRAWSLIISNLSITTLLQVWRGTRPWKWLMSSWSSYLIKTALITNNKPLPMKQWNQHPTATSTAIGDNINETSIQQQLRQQPHQTHPQQLWIDFYNDKTCHFDESKHFKSYMVPFKGSGFLL